MCNVIFVRVKACFICCVQYSMCLSKSVFGKFVKSVECAAIGGFQVFSSVKLSLATMRYHQFKVVPCKV